MRSWGGSLAPTANVYIFLSRREGLLQWQLFVCENYIVTVKIIVGLTCIDKIINVDKFAMENMKVIPWSIGTGCKFGSTNPVEAKRLPREQNEA